MKPIYKSDRVLLSMVHMSLTCVGLRKSIRFSIGSMYRKFLDPLNALEIQKATQRHSGGTGCKAKNLGAFFAIKRFQSSPPPNNIGI